MSVAGYLGKPAGELRLEPGDVQAAGRGGDVLEGKISVEKAQQMVDLQARDQLARCSQISGGLERRAGPVRAYRTVAEYDPVLRSHCRLDKEG